MANVMRYRWGPLSLKWVHKATSVDVEQGDILKWASGGTVTPATTSANATDIMGIAMSASPTSDATDQQIRVAEIGHGTVFEFTVDDSSTYTVGTYFIITGNQTLDSNGEMTTFASSGTNCVAVCIEDLDTAGTEVLVQFLPGMFQAQILAI